MKPETFVCIQGSPLIPKGSRAEWDNVSSTYTVRGADGSLLYVSEHRMATDDHLRLKPVQVEKNPECWQRVGTECTHPTQSPAKNAGEGETNYFTCDICKEPC